MTVTLASLVPAPTQTSVLSTLLALLQSGGFPTTAWNAGSVPSRLLNAESANYADGFAVVGALANGGYLSTATGDWLTLLASEFYQITRGQAIVTVGNATLTDAGGAGPFTIVPAQLTISSDSGLLYTNATGGVLAKGGALPLSWQAVSPGAIYNVGNGGISTLVTSLPGVRVSNPAPLGFRGSSGTWITQVGADAEDDKSVRTRCRARWPGLGGGATVAVYKAWAIAASNEVRRVAVFENTPSNGQVTVVLAGGSGGVSSAAVSAVAAFLQTVRPLCVKTNVQSAVAYAVSVTATLRVKAAQSSTALAAALLALGAYGTTLGIGDPVYVSSLIAALMTVPGAVEVVTTTMTPASDVVLLPANPTFIPQLVPTITIQSV